MASSRCSTVTNSCCRCRAGGGARRGADAPARLWPVAVLVGIGPLVADLRARHPFLSLAQAWRLVRGYGTEAATILAGATSAADLGQAFGAGLFAREVDWLTAHEFAVTAEDILWRRTRLGLHLTPEQAAALAAYLQG